MSKLTCAPPRLASLLALSRPKDHFRTGCSGTSKNARSPSASVNHRLAFSLSLFHHLCYNRLFVASTPFLSSSPYSFSGWTSCSRTRSCCNALHCTALLCSQLSPTSMEGRGENEWMGCKGTRAHSRQIQHRHSQSKPNRERALLRGCVDRRGTFRGQ